MKPVKCVVCDETLEGISQPTIDDGMEDTDVLCYECSLNSAMNVA